MKFNEIQRISMRFLGSVAPRACFFAIPTAFVALFLAYADSWLGPEFKERTGLLQAQESQPSGAKIN